ncbi:MAG TPA: 4-(cytidine 5'-diphospho)-2-C-methyl-D-erythritol kinase [Cyclobacteriaceae bacterium]|nr:4-(cytidine 5'-diphospho)-2-C-methyl-D-erythritol kinase [Cyclobacteriaceae bacterium]
MVAFPPGKINIGLQVLSRRSDGYHDLSTCFYPVPATDVLEIIASDQFRFDQTGIPIPGVQADNLCVKAYGLLREQHELPPVHIHLHKVIPTGAGLGGGSSDAAYTLRLLNNLFSLNLSADKLMGYAARLGSDCAFFCQDRAMMGRGRGEILSPANASLKGYFLMLIKPPVHVSTAEAYAGITPEIPLIELSILLQTPVSAWKDKVQNDFEKSVFARFPEIAAIKKRCYEAGAVYASMSGSGATVFALFDREVTLSGEFTDAWRWSGWL